MISPSLALNTFFVSVSVNSCSSFGGNEMQLSGERAEDEIYLSRLAFRTEDCPFTME